MGMKLSDEVNAEILRRTIDGQGRSEIGLSLGLSHQTVSAALKRLGVATLRKPRSDKGRERDRTSEDQIDWINEYQPAPEPAGKRAYEFSALVLSSSKVNNAQTLAIAGLEPYLPEPPKVTQLDFSLLIPAFAPLPFRRNVVKRKKEIAMTDTLIERLVQRFRCESGLLRLGSKYRSLVIPAVLSNLLLAHQSGKQVIYSRDRNRANRLYLNFIDWLASANLITNHVQPKQAGGNRLRSWMCATPALAALFNLPEPWGLTLSSKFKPVVYRVRGDGDKWVDAAPPEKFRRAIAEAGKFVRRYNEAIERVAVSYAGRYPIACFIHRVMNGAMDQGGRLYGGQHETMPKEYRKHIQIDGEPTVELDYSALHPNLLLWLTGSPECADPYSRIAEEAGLSREAVKALMLRLINANTEADFCRTVTRSGNPEEKAKVARDSAKAFDGFIEGVPDGYTGGQFIEAVTRAFPTFTGVIGSGIGLTLQYHDSEIMADILTRCLDAGFIGLPVHDSVIVPASRQDEARRFMADAYAERTGGRSILIK